MELWGTTPQSIGDDNIVPLTQLVADRVVYVVTVDVDVDSLIALWRVLTEPLRPEVDGRR